MAPFTFIRPSQLKQLPLLLHTFLLTSSRQCFSKLLSTSLTFQLVVSLFQGHLVSLEFSSTTWIKILVKFFTLKFPRILILLCH